MLLYKIKQPVTLNEIKDNLKEMTHSIPVTIEGWGQVILAKDGTFSAGPYPKVKGKYDKGNPEEWTHGLSEEMILEDIKKKLKIK